MTARNINEAWNIANEIFPTDYSKDENASERAGYPIYRSTASDNSAYICDLGDRLEVNAENGASINIWIEDDTQPTQPTERRESVITLEIDIHHHTHESTAAEHHETALILSYDTPLKDIATFENKAEAIIKKARKAAADGDFVFVTLSKAVYRFTSCFDIKQEAFEHWAGYGDSITDEGAYLTPSADYNSDPAHDMWITGKRGEIFKEMTI